MKKKITAKKKTPDRASDLPVTVGIIEEFREEMRASFRSVDYRFESLRSELKADIKEVKAEIEEVKADTSRTKMLVEEVKADSSRTKMLVEEQNNKNNVVLDGLTFLFERQERVEGRVDGVEHTIALFKKATP